MIPSSSTQTNLKRILPFADYGHHEDPKARLEMLQRLVQNNPGALHTLLVELTQPGVRGEVSSSSLLATLLDRLRDHLREANISVHGVTPVASGYDDAGGTNFTRAYVTFPTTSLAHTGANVLQQHANAKLPSGTLKVLPRTAHPDESHPGDRFHPSLMTLARS